MNKFWLLGFSGLVLFAGCKRQQPDQTAKEIAELRERISQLEQRVDVVTDMSNRFYQVHQMLQTQETNWDTLSALVQEEYQRNTEVRETVVQYLSGLTNAPKPRKQSKFLQPWEVQQQQLSVSSSAQIDSPSHPGVPQSVYDRICDDARKEWPGDYKMQVFVINQQIEAYLKLRSSR